MNPLQKFTLVFLVALLPFGARGQRFLTDMMDTTTALGRDRYLLYHDYDKLSFAGYMQPQFQATTGNGAKSYEGGDFAQNADDRFTLRRGRIRIDYLHMNDRKQPLALFAFQFDGTERGVAIRDFWGRIYDPKFELFALTTGLFARPMGFEVNLSSAERESPERGRMSQILMRTERDLGAMLTFEPRGTRWKYRWMKLDVGLFNGQGILTNQGTTDYDSHKDLIARFSLKPTVIRKLRNAQLSASISTMQGGVVSQSKYVYGVEGKGADAYGRLDSSDANAGAVRSRQYYGGDVQLKIPNRRGATELRAEYIRGFQTGTATTSESPQLYPTTTAGVPVPLFTRPFDGAYFYFLQHLGTSALQLVLKYDWYDPNTSVKGNEVATSKGLGAADLRYDTFGGGLVWYVNLHVKATLYYARVVNETTTGVAGYGSDLKDDVFTARLQFRF